MESFQQSGLKTSLANLRRRVPSGGATEASIRLKAMEREISPLKISLRRTAVPAEYARPGGVDTRE